jgi:aspartyl-tRNA(Asn)/glutamyl-tRNA(Gln) amidotransferase subunit A
MIRPSRREGRCLLGHSELVAVIDNPELRGEVSVADVVDSLLARIDEYQPKINAFITVTDDGAREEARRIDDARERDEDLGPLAGMVVAVKDNIDVAGVRATVGSKFFQHRVAQEDAEVVRRLRAAGAVIVGKTALHEFAFGTTTRNPHYGPCRNPWKTTCIAGGSSGGSAAALAADLCIGALGSDTGGSVRIPAALCGVSGLRPTLGAISTRGTFPVSVSFDTVGPMARSVADIACMYRVIAGYDPLDPMSVDRAIPGPARRPERALAGRRVALPTNYFFEDVHPGIDEAVRGAADRFAELGAAVSQIVIDGVEQAPRAMAVIRGAEALALHRERLRKHPDWFGEDVLKRLELGAPTTGVDFALALQRMREWRASILRVFEEVDFIMTPTTPITAPPIESEEIADPADTLIRLTSPWSFAGLPGLSIPCGFDRAGMPIGLQLAAAPWRESDLVAAGSAYQAATDWHRRRPGVER